MTTLAKQKPASSYHVFSAKKAPAPLKSRRLLVRFLAAIIIFFGLAVVAALLVTMSPTLSRSLTAIFIHEQKGAIPWNGTDPVKMVIVGLDTRPGMTGQFS